MSDSVIIVGGGLAGTEAALVLARAGQSVRLMEMRPEVQTPAHDSGDLAELVCSNSLRSDEVHIAAGLLKEELRHLSSPLVALADSHRVPAGGALAVDRANFSRAATECAETSAGIELIRGEVRNLPDSLALLTPGPLASDALMTEIGKLIGTEHRFFFDAVAPIVEADSLDQERLFAGNRYGRGEPDYLNSPMDERTYLDFVLALLDADQFVPHGFDATDKLPLFSGCQPIEAIAESGLLSLAHGPMRPKGFMDNPLGNNLYALVQLRAENKARSAYNLVGFQTRLKQAEQKRIFRLIPGLENARFLRYGSLHRNSYIDGPRVLQSDLSLGAAPHLYVAGQFAGGEGYIESIALGHLAALFILAKLRSTVVPVPPEETALGALVRHVTGAIEEPLQPSHIHWGLFPSVRGGGRRKEKRLKMVERARGALQEWLQVVQLSGNRLSCEDR
jgi:methylenetetrahydrofolate--tRNA-(uracil-5-)-methyltransferase